MNFKPLPRYSGNSAIALAAPTWNRTADMIERALNVSYVGAVRVTQSPNGTVVAVGAPARTVPFIGVVVDAGPDGEADYTDERYWVRRSRIDGTDASVPIPTPADPTTPLTTSYWDDDNGDPVIVTATNLTENSLDKETSGIPRYEKGPHAVPLGRRVVVWSDIDTANPNNTRYFFVCAPFNVVLVKIVSETAGAGKYNGVILYAPTTDYSPYTDAVLADVGVDGVDCWVINTAELGQTGHALTDDGANRSVYMGIVRPRSRGAGGYEDEDGNEVDPETLVGGETAVADRPVVIIGDYDWAACASSRDASTDDFFGL
jgi:hypothetical protein